MAIEYARLYPDTTQLQAKNGANLTDGYVLVFLAGTDDPAVTYSDFNGTRNPQRIVVDDNGRFTAIVDKSKAYRVEVYDANGMLLWTAEPVWCTGNSGSGISSTRVVSTDGSISVDESVAGSERTYDIGLAPSDSDEFLEWVKCVDEAVSNGDIFPTYVEGTMETMGGQGLHVGKDRFYHGTVTVKVVPTGTGINYETLSASLKFGDDTVVRRNFDIDNSLHDSVVCEFSYDFKAPEDGYLYLNLENVGVFSQVDVEMQVHRIYSGINAVPDTCATKQWVQETFDYSLSGKIGYSALEYNPTGEISGISGSAIATTDPSVVSAIASSYAESAVSGISAWSGDFSSISSKLDASASSMFAPSGDYAYNSGLSSKLDASASGDFVLVSSYSSFSSDITNNITSISSVVSSKADSSALSSYQPVSAMSSYATESYVDSAVSSKLDVTASSLFITALPDDLATTGDVASAVSGKMDASAYDSAWFQPASSMSAWIPYSALDYSGTAISGIGGSSLAGMGGGADYSGVTPVNVNNDARLISVNHRTLCVDETLTAYDSGSSAVLGVNTASIDLPTYQRTADMTAYQPVGIYIYESALGWEEI